MTKLVRVIPHIFKFPSDTRVKDVDTKPYLYGNVDFDNHTLIPVLGAPY